ncbi:MAG: 50S ribosomal protein L29 [Bacteroidetes bacterium]|jgi:large subunit ribosomal protein L29|nr:50S ribosomal protein L29 [Bacteroidota bacterium]MDA0937392.1 50S ribosomal protein L29 [Bacteroidota bacterium]MDA1344740.1 50S ribosomal protein L29 [Bacteroidota bacterium]
MKQSEITNLSIEDLNDKLQQMQNELNDLKMNHAITPLENPAQIRTVRRTIARLLTAKTAKEQETN